MDAWEALITRQSVPPAMLQEPAPDDAELAELLAAAVCAPDHGAIRPWRFVAIRGEGRDALADIFVEALKNRAPEADEAAIEKERQRPLRAPLIVAVCAITNPSHPKVPVIEQIVSAGAAAHNLLIACHVHGYGAIMLTGDNAYDQTVQAASGLEAKDALVGFVYIGTPKQELRAKKRPPVERFLTVWPRSDAAAAE